MLRYSGGGGGANLEASSTSTRNSRTSSSFMNFKCCAVGDAGVGKTSMLMAYCVEGWQPNRGFIPGIYVPNRPFIVPSGDSGTCITLTIKDTRGAPEAEELRAYDCTGADCLLVCFSVVDKESYNSVESHWLPFMARTCPDAALLLVGTKTDLRKQPQDASAKLSAVVDEEVGSRNSAKRISETEISSKMGAKLAKKIRAYQYLECSSMDKDSLETVFTTAIRTFTENPTADQAGCNSATTKDKMDSSGGGKKCLIS
ncbi:hypothetical protein BOX15_Mlig007759g1 [Macrostomum lignano]|uniref:Uncharacterized protein n=2 Tax=Macrostomum lignano TaxID=282301 RepID=A0A267FE86_9PLAT|nr:hypothetical protein BOX15_Mlig007759g1 [Macrostomum lignano]